MKTIDKLFILLMTVLILSVSSIQLFSQPEPPPLPDQHGYNGNQSTQSAPLDEGLEVLLSLGIVYLAVKMAAGKRNTIVVR
jgi:hypothetical protein